MEIFLAGEILPDQFGADYFAVALYQAAIGLMVEQDLGCTGHGQRISEPGYDGHADDHNDGRTDVLQHGSGSLKPGWERNQASPTVVISISISLMPTNGAMMPPSP